MTVHRLDRNTEIRDKLAAMRRWLDLTGSSAIRLRGTDWFSWATAGGSNAVLLAAETGVAEVLVTPKQAWILTDEIEAGRLRDEEVPSGYEWNIVPWAHPERRELFVNDVAEGKRILSDKPGGLAEEFLPETCLTERMVLHLGEQDRYQQVCLLAAEAMSEVMRSARPEWTERELAGAGAEALWVRGLHPALTLAAGEARLPKYRHATPSMARLGKEAMLVFCARGHGLYANLTRFVRFGGISDVQRRLDSSLLVIEAAGLQACIPGQPLSSVYHALAKAYKAHGRTDQIHAHHQGGITGYAAREILAFPGTSVLMHDGMALAFNPSLPGAKLEDTFLMRGGNLENMTFDPTWPMTMHAGRPRPEPLEA